MQSSLFTLFLLLSSVYAYDLNLRRTINGTRVGSFTVDIQDAWVKKVRDMEYSLSGNVKYYGYI